MAMITLNFTPMPHHSYRIGLPKAGVWHEAFNSDSAFYAGANVGNSGAIATQPLPWMDRNQSTEITLPPLATLVLLHQG